MVANHEPYLKVDEMRLLVPVVELCCHHLAGGDGHPLVGVAVDDVDVLVAVGGEHLDGNIIRCQGCQINKHAIQGDYSGQLQPPDDLDLVSSLDVQVRRLAIIAAKCSAVNTWWNIKISSQQPTGDLTDQMGHPV